MAADAKKDDKAESAAEEDLSMEDILQSIRKIIAEDDSEGKKAVPTENAKTNGSKTEAAGSDILELTEMVKDDGSVVNVKAEAAKPAAGGDILNKIDEALAPAKAAEKPAAPVAPAAPAAKDSLLSEGAASAAASAFKRLQTAEPEVAPLVTTPAPPFRDGTTVEDLVAEMLRPMMKDWLDRNLPPIVERIVEREVKKLTR